MTPGGRIAAAIGVLDHILEGAGAEEALLGWSRSSRFAGSGDRAAVRDHVFDALRCRRSFGALGGADTGRGLMIGKLRAEGIDPTSVFTGTGHAPPALAPQELAAGRPAEGAEALDVPDWLVPLLRQSLAADCEPVLSLLRRRADLHLRVARHRCSRIDAQALLLQEGIGTEPHPLSETALRVTAGMRKVAQCAPWRDGLVEIQDAASQAVVDRIPFPEGPVLDLCAGGGGKALALAARGAAPVFVHDALPRRMADLPARASRAKSVLQPIATEHLSKSGRFALVVADVPCSGSGAWRRQPLAKWRLDPAGLARLQRTQAGILDQAADLTASGGCLAYVTCSLLDVENTVQAEEFLARWPSFACEGRHRFTPLEGGDGFFLALFRRSRAS